MTVEPDAFQSSSSQIPYPSQGTGTYVFGK